VKGQTQAVTAVLITTVMIGAIATAYVWGGPLLQKGQAEADLDQVENEVRTLYENIEQVSESGSGAAETLTLDLDTGGSGETRIDINEDENYIDIVTESGDIPYPRETWTVIEGQNLQNLSIVEEENSGDYGISGQDSKGVVAVRPIGEGSENIVTYRIEFRNMLSQTPDGTKLEKVDIRARDSATETGTVQTVVSNEGQEYDSESDMTLSTGESIERERTVVEIDLR